MSGTVICGSIERTQLVRRFMNASLGYGGGSAASASEPLTPHGESSHVPSPRIIPKPIAMRLGPSRSSARPMRNRLVAACSANAPRSEAPKITHVVGCTYVATMPSRNIAARAPQDVRPGT
jgi:hypothetical protein